MIDFEQLNNCLKSLNENNDYETLAETNNRKLSFTLVKDLINLHIVIRINAMLNDDLSMTFEKPNILIGELLCLESISDPDIPKMKLLLNALDNCKSQTKRVAFGELLDIIAKPYTPQDWKNNEYLYELHKDCFIKLTNVCFSVPDLFYNDNSYMGVIMRLCRDTENIINKR